MGLLAQTSDPAFAIALVGASFGLIGTLVSVVLAWLLNRRTSAQQELSGHLDTVQGLIDVYREQAIDLRERVEELTRYKEQVDELKKRVAEMTRLLDESAEEIEKLTQEVKRLRFRLQSLGHDPDAPMTTGEVES